MSPNIISNDLPKLHQDKLCQYCSKEFNSGSTHWKKFCSRECRQNQYIFNKTGKKPMSHDQVSSAALSFLSQNDAHKIHLKPLFPIIYDNLKQFPIQLISWVVFIFSFAFIPPIPAVITAILGFFLFRKDL